MENDAKPILCENFRSSKIPTRWQGVVAVREASWTAGESLGVCRCLEHESLHFETSGFRMKRDYPPANMTIGNPLEMGVSIGKSPINSVSFNGMFAYQRISMNIFSMSLFAHLGY